MRATSTDSPSRPPLLPLPRRATVFLLLALLLAAVVAVLGGLGFERRLESFRPLGFEMRYEEGGWRVAEIHAPDTGLSPGDEVLLVAGVPAAAGTPADPRTIAELLGRRPESELVVVRDGLPMSVVYRRPALSIDVPYLMLTAIGLLYFLVGLYTVVRHRQAPTGLFYLWCLAMATLFVLSPVQPSRDAIDRLIYHGDQTARSLAPFLTLHLFLVFPTPLWRRLGRASALLYLPPALLLALHFDLFGRTTENLLRRIDQLEPYLLVAASLLGALALWQRFARRPEWDERRQILWILCGLVGGSVPLLVLYLFPRSLGLVGPSWTTVASVLPLALVPLTFAWAIFKYQLLDLAIILRQTATYGLTLLVGLFAFTLVRLLIDSGVADQLPVSRVFLTFAAGVTIAGALAPTKNAIASGLERLQYRASIGSRQMLTELGHELLHERDLDRLCATLLEHLGDGLVVRATLYLGQGGAMVPVEPTPELPPVLAFDAFGADLWHRDVKAVSAIGLPQGEMPAEQRLFALGYRYAFPLTVRRHQIGVALLSYKYDAEPLNSEDLDIARGVFNQAALALENAQLLEEVHRKLVELTRLEEYSKGILECSPAGIAVLDREARVVSANHAFAAVVGVARPETVGRPLEELLPVRPLPAAADGLVEVSYCEPAGGERYLQLAVARHQQAEELSILILQDVSERRAMEMALEEKERLASLGMLAAGVAHEVNTPLTGISSYAQLLLADVDPDDPHYEILRKMERQTFRAAQIVNNLLEFARSRGGFAPVDLRSVLSESIQLLEERVRASGVTIRWQPPAAAMSVSGKEGELHQVMNNILVNALDAVSGRANGGRRQIEATMEAVGQRIRTRITDSGPGIPAERLESIFRPFHSSKLSQGGSGLGLAITYNIVRRHGGEIRAENNRGAESGCTFTVELPCEGALAVE